MRGNGDGSRGRHRSNWPHCGIDGTDASIAGVVAEPGLHLKAPFFIDQVTRLDTRQQLIESPLETVLTRDGQQVLVQAFMTWRIDTTPEEALRCFRTVFKHICDDGICVCTRGPERSTDLECPCCRRWIPKASRVSVNATHQTLGDLRI
jgi:hypothetical protein